MYFSGNRLGGQALNIYNSVDKRNETFVLLREVSPAAALPHAFSSILFEEN
jgi:hypothetical protein